MIAAQRAAMPDRPAPTWRQRINPFWLLCDRNQPSGWDWLSWLHRNPCCNLNAVVIGVSHLPRVVVTTASPWTWPERGWNLGWTIAAGWRGLFPLPLIARRGHRWEIAIGWKTSGGFTPFTCRRANSPNAGPTPD